MLGDRFIDTWLALSCLCSGIHYIASSEMNTDEKDVAEVIEHMTVLVQSPGQNIGNIHKI